MKQKVIPILIVIAGFLLLAYPFLSNYLFEKSAGSTVESYQEKTDMMDQKIKEKALDEARGYNENLLRSSIQLTDPFKTKKINGETVFYNNILNVDRSEIMGYVKIPCISVDLPIYHGTSAEVLERGIGHTGLSSAKLFTDLTEMKKGDLFFIHVLDKKLAYRVDRITVVKPEDTRNLQIIDGEDHVTLLTCTPYGVNDHRLLVRGKRTRYHEKEEQTKERPHHSQWMEGYKQAILIGLLIVFSLVGSRKMYGRIKGRKKK